MISENTFLWHDYETFGADPRIDRPCQFAAIRTNEALEPIEAPTIFYCQPSVDTLPQPMACFITGITPQYAFAHGEPEPKFAQQIFDIMSRPGTCVVGYNNLRFDDEVTRHLFWRNFLDPYAREYSNGNSRFDLINLLRLTRALRPDGLNWPNYEDGQANFRLEDIAKANGLDIQSAHDALVDVENTLAIAQLVFKHQPKLWAWALKLRDKRIVDELLTPKKPLLFASSWFAKRPGSLTAILPLARHPALSNQWIAWDLSIDPSPWFAQSSVELQDALATRSRTENEDWVRNPITTIKINQVPMLAPLTVADEDTLARLELDLELCDNHQRSIEENPAFIEGLIRATSDRNTQYREFIDPEADLYGGFVARQDQSLIRRIPSLEGPALGGFDEPFSDPRLNTLLLRYRARHYPESLSADDQAKWKMDCQHRLGEGVTGAGMTLAQYRETLEAFAQTHPDQSTLLEALQAWVARSDFPLSAKT